MNASETSVNIDLEINMFHSVNRASSLNVNVDRAKMHLMKLVDQTIHSSGLKEQETCCTILKG